MTENFLNDPSSAALAKAASFAAEVDRWTAAGIADGPAAERCGDLLRIIRIAESDAEKERKAETEPHRLAVASINARWRPVSELLGAAKERITSVIKAFERKERDRLAAEAAALAAAAAEAKRKAAEEARKAVESETTAASVSAMQAQQEAEGMAEAAASAPTKVVIGGIYGKAITMRRGPAKARIAHADNAEEARKMERDAVLWVLKTYRQTVLEFVAKLASADARSKKPLPACFEVYHEETVA